MAISVVTNVSSIRSQRNLAKVTQSTTKNIERLSSGLRINRAGDDAARSAISSQMSPLELGLKQADRNANSDRRGGTIRNGMRSEICWADRRTAA